MAFNSKRHPDEEVGSTLGVIHDSLRLFMLCKMMEWNHLPAAGGIFDQDPKLLEDWEVVWRIEQAAEERRQTKAERDAKRAGDPAGKAPARTVNRI